MKPDNPYAAPQTLDTPPAEPDMNVEVTPLIGDLFRFHEGAARAKDALEHALWLVLAALFFGVLSGAIDTLLYVTIALALIVAILISWHFYSGLAQMADASQLLLRVWLTVAKRAFMAGWICYVIKGAVLISMVPHGRQLFFSIDLLDNVAGVIMVLALGISTLALGHALYQSDVCRNAWLMMTFLGGSYLTFFVIEASLLFEPVLAQSPVYVEWQGKLSLILVVFASCMFLAGYFSLKNLLSLLSQLPSRKYTHNFLLPGNSVTLEPETKDRLPLQEGQP